jgi:hypothetical protein
MANRLEKGQIVYLCSLLMMVFVILSYLAIQQLQSSNAMRLADEGIELQHGISLEIFKTDVDFFGYELNNAEFYRTGQSVYLERHDSLMRLFNVSFQESDQEEVDKKTGDVLNSYDSAFKEIVRKIKQRGFKDYGLEGKMRSFAHQLEQGKLISPVDYLTLRRHEKDYLLRSDKGYVDKYDSLVKIINSKIVSGAAGNLLRQYSEAFHELVGLSDAIGLESQTNLKGKLNVLTKKLITTIDGYDRIADKEVLGAYHKGLTFLLIGIIGAALLCIFLVVLIAKKL